MRYEYRHPWVIDIDIRSVAQTDLLRHILHYVRAIYRELHHPVLPSTVQINQIDSGGNTMAITGTPAGGSSTFEADAILNGVQDPAGWPAGTVDSWTCDDPAAVVGPDSGPDVNQPGALDQVKVSIPATDTQGSAPAGSPGSYNLTVSVQMPAADGVIPAPLVSTINVPITSAPAPVPSGVVINQIS